MTLDRTATVAQIVTEHAAAARVFQKHRIDFCCGGDVTVAEACRNRPVEPDALFAELEATLPEAGAGDAEDPRALSTPELIGLIVERHHGYLRQALPYLAPLAAKVARVHGEHNPKLAPLLETFTELRAALEPHIDDEERTLFPALVAASSDPAALRGELAGMLEEHRAVGALLERSRSLSDGFTVPEWGCNSYRVLMAELEALETDVLRHVHLENHVLMPRFV
ncbi:iron-sulfur cluster repair di-iron protein [Anaeromyxobacter diazotrophicus]|uniref:Iron-sulfur cluster repair di-iron protein n=1 Tax=Anaeromyxobacter diazotrophicus TaxID=2590199 RepID=A0A7I9VGE7_9BACT|nr:iron-sulfur cluster repair di-iron protein [Anaeromyxobacter diazotrophicus]GEJ55415.1 iron-sulfur cluster repair di-iron protein [Anaeromyxobacter diazotrophicus]